ncbi:MFS transporter [Lentibacillus sp. N15]|uniref:MFS transporter n=1 Tax=Lentibacillus songyuanensis TaxID=3136161 RepID=UPI0031BB2071
MGDKSGKSRNIYIIMGVLIVLVAVSFARLSYGMILPFMKDGLFISYKSAGTLGTITSLGYLISIMFAGYLSTKWGGKNTIIVGLLLINLGFFNLSITTTYWYSSVFMFLLGIGTAFVFTPLIAILTEWFPQKKGFVIGCVNSSAGIGSLFVGILVPFLADIYIETSWRITWKIFCIIGGLVFFMTIFFIKNPPVAKEALIQPSSPVKKIYTNRNVIKVGLIYGIVGMTLIVQTTFILSFMLEEGLDMRLAGQLIALNGILAIFSSPFWGGISDRLGRRNSLVIAMSLNLLSTIIPVVLPNTIGFAVNLVIQGVVAFGIMTLVQALSTEQSSSQDTPIVISYTTFYFATGQFLGPTLAGWLIDYSGFKSTFLFFALCMFIGLFIIKIIKVTEIKTVGNSSADG